MSANLFSNPTPQAEDTSSQTGGAKDQPFAIAQPPESKGQPAPPAPEWEPGPETTYRIAGVRAGAVGAIATTFVCVTAAAPILINATLNLFGSASAQALAKVDLMTTLNASTIAALFGVVTFALIPEIEKTRREAARLAYAQSTDHRAMLDRIDKLIALVETMTRQNAMLQREVAEAARNPSNSVRSRNGERANRPDAFRGAGPGPTVTLEPYMVQEAHIETLPDGSYQIYAADNDVPESISRLEPPHQATRWQVVFPLRHDRECLQALIRFVWSLNHYARVAAYRGRTLDYSKLEVRVTDTKPTGYTVVVFPQIVRGADVQMTVLQYTFADVKTGNGRIAVAVRGPLYEKALQRRDEALARSFVVPAGALVWMLGDCLPDRSGRVPAAAVERWLSTSMPTIGQLVSWQAPWEASPEF